MSDRYKYVPTTGRHRGGRLNDAITSSVRAQEAIDPTKARKQPAKSAGSEDARAEAAAGEKRDRKGPAGRN